MHRNAIPLKRAPSLTVTESPSPCAQVTEQKPEAAPAQPLKYNSPAPAPAPAPSIPEKRAESPTPPLAKVRQSLELGIPSCQSRNFECLETSRLEDTANAGQVQYPALTWVDPGQGLQECDDASALCISDASLTQTSCCSVSNFSSGLHGMQVDPTPPQPLKSVIPPPSPSPAPAPAPQAAPASASKEQGADFGSYFKAALDSPAPKVHSSSPHLA